MDISIIQVLWDSLSHTHTHTVVMLKVKNYTYHKKNYYRESYQILKIGELLPQELEIWEQLKIL